MPLTLYRRGAIWHYRGTVARRRLRGSTGTSDRETAERIKAETERAAWRRYLDGPAAAVTFAQAAIAYRQAEKPTRFLARVEDHWRDTPLREITAEAVRQAARKLYPAATGATRNRQGIVPTVAIINHAASLGWCSPMRAVRFDGDDAKVKTPATSAWVEAFARQAAADGLPHFAALVLFLFGTGARVGEAAALTWGDLDLTAATATIRLYKPRPWTRTAHLPPPVVAALANIPSNRDPEAPVFGLAGRGSVTKTWNNIAARALLEPLTPTLLSSWLRYGDAAGWVRRGDGSAPRRLERPRDDPAHLCPRARGCDRHRQAV